MHYFLLAAWATCVCLSVIGYGKALLSLCKLHNPRWALAGCIGVGFLAGIGGILEITNSVRPPVLFVLIFIGVAFLATSVWRSRRRLPDLVASLLIVLKENKTVALLLLLLVVLTGIRMIGNLEASYFLLSDDLSAYLSYPTEMLQRGSLPSDPFSERRIQSALGGAYFLQTLTMLASDARSVRFIDWGFGSALYVGVVFAICRRLRLSVATSLAVAVLTFIIPLRRQNVTMLALPAALFCALFLIELMEELDKVQWWLRPLLLGITASAICTLKSSYIPAAVLICGVYYAGEVVMKPRRRLALLQAGICALVAVSCLAPWMLDQKRKEGTYLFPILGRGYEASAYGVIPLPSGSQNPAHSIEFWASILPLLIPFLIAIAVQLIGRQPYVGTWWSERTSFFIAICGGIAAMALATGGDSIARYTMPFVAPGVILFCAYTVRWMGLAKPRPVWLTCTMVFCVVWIGAVAVRYGVQTHIYREYITDLGIPPLSNDIVRLDAKAEKGRVAALQASIPAGEPILEHLFVSYPLDFRRNPIFIADFPGLAGSPPGMPIGRGPLPLRRYLLENAIRFVAFTYGRGKILDLTPGLTLQKLISDPEAGGRHTWLFMQNKIACDVQANLEALSKQYLCSYDDGESCVVDMMSSVGPT